MVIATFGSTTGWSGKTITHEGDVFILEDHGPITAADVMEYDRQGQLTWANDGTRAWVGARVAQSAAPTEPRVSGGGPSAASSSPDSSRIPLSTILSRHLLLVVVLAVAVVVVVAVLAVSGVFRGGESQPFAAQSGRATSAASARQTDSWPLKLAGTWVIGQGTLSSRMVIAESGGQAKITYVMANGVVDEWTFAGETDVDHLRTQSRWLGTLWADCCVRSLHRHVCVDGDELLR